MRPMTRRIGVGVIGAAALYVGLVLSGIKVAHKSQEMRGLFERLASNQAAQDALLQEHSRLLLERGALSAYQNVDRVAEAKLAMRFPERVERVQR